MPSVGVLFVYSIPGERLLRIYTFGPHRLVGDHPPQNLLSGLEMRGRRLWRIRFSGGSKNSFWKRKMNVSV